MTTTPTPTTTTDITTTTSKKTTPDIGKVAVVVAVAIGGSGGGGLLMSWLSARTLIIGALSHGDHDFLVKTLPQTAAVNMLIMINALVARSHFGAIPLNKPF